MGTNARILSVKNGTSFDDVLENAKALFQIGEVLVLVNGLPRIQRRIIGGEQITPFTTLLGL